MAVHLLLLLFGEKYNWWNYPIVGGSFTDLFDVFGLLDDENNTIINVTTKILTIAPVIAMTTTLFLTGLNKISTKTSHIIVAICFGIPSLCTIINIADTLISHELAAYDAYISIIPLTAFLIMLFLSHHYADKNKNQPYTEQNTQYSTFCNIPVLRYIDHARRL